MTTQTRSTTPDAAARSESPFVVTRIDDVINWARKWSLFTYPFVTACCGMEYMALAGPRYDIARFGAEFPRFSPRQADLLMVVGTVSHKQAPVLKRIYDQMCEPKWVIAFGVCASSGGFYNNYATVQGIDTIIPVDVYIPGCPPRPEAVLDGLMLLQKKIGLESRPLVVRDAPEPVVDRAHLHGGAQAHPWQVGEGHMFIEMGPSHPAMHGTVRMHAEVDGEKLVRVELEPGYLHRAFEKSAEKSTWTQVFPYTDRLNYVSPMHNNVAYALAVEKLLGLDVTTRCKLIRMLVSELSRIVDHITCVAATAMELGGFTAFLYFIEARDLLWDLVEAICGARLTTSYARVGGLAADLPEDFEPRCREVLTRCDKLVADCDALLTRNRIFMDRMVDVGVVSKEVCLEYAFTGPCLRGSGVAYDIRKDHPYLLYKDFDFEVPVGERGDNYDRYLVRMEEIRQAGRLVDQLLVALRTEKGPINLDVPSVVLPAKDEVYHTIEGMMNHFKIIYEGIQVPKGECYSYTESPNGELGFYLVSDGKGRPFKCRVRPPCFATLQGLPEMLKDAMIADLVPTFGSVNMIGGECDR